MKSAEEEERGRGGKAGKFVKSLDHEKKKKQKGKREKQGTNHVVD